MGTSFFPGMLGGGFGTLGGSCNIFTNCFGEPNYDAIAGAGVGNIIVSTTGNIISSIVANRKAEKQDKEDITTTLENLDNQIADLKAKEPETLIDDSYNENISKAEEQKSSTEASISDLKEQLRNETDDAKKTEIQGRLKDAEAILETLNAGESVEGSIAYLKKQKEDAIDAKRVEIENQIASLEAKKAKLQNQVDEQKLDDADGHNWQKTCQKDFDKKWNKDGTPVAKTEFTKGDMRYAIGAFRNAVTDEDKKIWANKIAVIYDNFMNNNMKYITKDFKAARQIVDEYVG